MAELYKYTTTGRTFYLQPVQLASKTSIPCAPPFILQVFCSTLNTALLPFTSVIDLRTFPPSDDGTAISQRHLGLHPAAMER